MFTSFFTDTPLQFLKEAMRIAVKEDGKDATSLPVFEKNDIGSVRVVTKAPCVLCGVDCIPTLFLVLEECGYLKVSDYTIDIIHHDTTKIDTHDKFTVATITGPLLGIFKAERIILNYMMLLSGIATYTNTFVQQLGNSGIILLDTRKTAPALRYPEKYAVRCGGAQNHRMDLASMILVRDIHIDHVHSITKVLEKIYSYWGDACPPIAIECRTIEEVKEAITCAPTRIMLDNMDLSTVSTALDLIPSSIETELTGGISLDSLSQIIALPKKPNFISVGSIIYNAMPIDCGIYLI